MKLTFFLFFSRTHTGTHNRAMYFTLCVPNGVICLLEKGRTNNILKIHSLKIKKALLRYEIDMFKRKINDNGNGSQRLEAFTETIQNK